MNNLWVLFSFQGRIRRLQWWLGSLIAVGVVLGVIILVGMTMATIYGDPDAIPWPLSVVVGCALFAAYGLLIWIQLALGVKRLHDRDNSGWWMLLQIVPLGGLVLLVMLGFLDGTQGPNKHGPSPKGVGGPVGDRELGGVFS